MQALLLAGRQDHAPHARVQGQFGQLVANGRQAVVFGHRAQLVEQLKTIRYRFGPRRFQKRKVGHIAQAQRHHPQNHARQRAAQNFGFGEARSAVEIFLVIQANANAIGHAAAAASALVGGGLADRLHQQLLHLASEAVALHTGHACIHHIADAGHGERCFGHVGGQHDARCAAGFKHPLLLGLRQPCKQRQHLNMAGVGVVRQVAAQVVGGIANLALARQKHQDVATRCAGPQLVHRIGNRVAQVMLAAFFPRAVTHLHRESAARHHQHRCGTFGRGKVLRKSVGVDGGRGDDDFQIGAARQDLTQIAQQKIDVQTALMRLVNDECVVGQQQRIGLRLGQQNAVGHQLHRGVARQLVLEAHLVAHHLAQRGFQLVGNPLGHRGGGNPARLRVANDLATFWFTRVGGRAFALTGTDIGFRAFALTGNEIGVRARVLLRKIGV